MRLRPPYIRAWHSSRRSADPIVTTLTQNLSRENLGWFLLYISGKSYYLTMTHGFDGFVLVRLMFVMGLL